MPCSHNTLKCSGYESLTTDVVHSIDKIQLCGTFFGNAEVKENDVGLQSTEHAFWYPLVKSFLIAEAGEIDGKNLFGGFYFVVILIKADTEYKINYLGIPGHWSSNFPCGDCKCEMSATPMRMNNFALDAPWKPTAFKTRLEWIAWCVLRGKTDFHPLFKPREDGGLGLHISYAPFEALHCLCIGLCLHVHGVVLWHLCYTDVVKADATPSERLAIVWQEICEEYKARTSSSRLSSLYLSSFTDPEKPHSDYPLLKTKGAISRHLLPVLKDIWCKHARPTVDYEQHISRCLINLTEVYACMNTKGPDGRLALHLPTEVVDHMQTSIDKFLTHYGYLSSMANDLNRKLFSITPKFHYLWHIGRQARWINPRSP